MRGEGGDRPRGSERFVDGKSRWEVGGVVFVMRLVEGILSVLTEEMRSDGEGGSGC